MTKVLCFHFIRIRLHYYLHTWPWTSGGSLNQYVLFEVNWCLFAKHFWVSGCFCFTLNKPQLLLRKKLVEIGLHKSNGVIVTICSIHQIRFYFLNIFVRRWVSSGIRKLVSFRYEIKKFQIYNIFETSLLLIYDIFGTKIYNMWVYLLFTI